MIVLDATNKSLTVDLPSSTGMTSVVSYWSVDASNAWTPRSLEVTAAQNSVTTILPAPGAGEVFVVENIWLNLRQVGGDFQIVFDTGGTGRNIAEIDAGGLAIGDTITLGRDGLVTRQEIAFSGSVTRSQNSH